jgi:AraC-like DNA-binding protein
VLEPGRLYLLNNAVPYRTAPRGEWRTFSLALPPAALRRRAPRLEPFYAIPLGDGSPQGDLLAAFAEHFATGLAAWDEAEFAELADRLIDLVALMVLRPNRPQREEGAAHALWRERALRHIRAHLGDPELRPEAVARACGISLSYLNQVFRAAGMGIEETIFAERLERSRAMLADPRHAHLGVTAIAYATGFSHPSHFSRAFRRRFGVAPSELRRGGATI